MVEQSICRERILSESYRDFIVDDIRNSFLKGISQDSLCLQDARFGYQCVYLSSVQSDPITVEKYGYTAIPKCYAPLSLDTLNQAGILPIQNFPTLKLNGSNVLIGFLDSGIDYTNSVFKNLDGSTRIAAIWDQTIQSDAFPDDFVYGSEYNESDINEALNSDDPFSIVPSRDTDGHGTFVASLAAGSGAPAENFLGAAPEATIAVVKLKPPKQYLRDFYFIPDSAVCYEETDIILGLKYLSLLAVRLQLPLVLCITLGTNSGGYSNTLPFSNLLDRYGDIPNIIPVVGVGNEAAARHHFFGTFSSTTTKKSVEIRVANNVDGFTMELWTRIPNILSISLISPSGENTGQIPIRAAGNTEYHFLFEGTTATIDYRLFVKRTDFELIYFRFQKPTAGIWKVNIEPVRILDGDFHLWLPIKEFLSGEVYFLDSNPYYTITSPGYSLRSVIVSYYNGFDGSLSLDSGRGYVGNTLVFPSITAPGINVIGAFPSEYFRTRSGSCISTAITAGATALLLEWILYQTGAAAIDSYQIKSLFSLGAIRPDIMQYPNPEWGFGQLNLLNTFDEIRKV